MGLKYQIKSFFLDVFLYKLIQLIFSLLLDIVSAINLLSIYAYRITYYIFIKEIFDHFKSI